MKRYFTLAELSIVLCCLSVLASLVLPVSNRPVDIAQKNLCMGNLRQSVSAMLSYSESHAGWVPLISSGRYSWFQFPTMPQELGIPDSADGFQPASRLTTFCPSVTIQGNPWLTSLCYGVPRFWGTTANDFNRIREVEFNIGDPAWTLVRVSILPNPSDYIILADSAFGIAVGANNPRQITGNPSPSFLRKDAGFAAISKRHYNVANTAFADGHVDDTSDRTNLWNKYRIGELVSADGLISEKIEQQ